MKLEARFIGTEVLVVGAGKFKTLKFSCEADYLDSQGRKFVEIRVDYWYAPDVKGMVKIDSIETRSSGEQFLRAELESFPARP